MELLDRVRQTIRRHDLARAGTRVVVALSGGSDSVALAHLLIALDRTGELTVSALAHLNHQLRPAANDDEQFCSEVARALERPFIAERADVGAIARAEQRSLEDAGRAARYSFFSRALAQSGAEVVALGHTRDDQAETFLLRLLRGAGARGLAAMHPRRDVIIRPVIDCRRADLRAFLDARQISFVHDESNEDVNIPRNRVRAELLPLLAQRFNPAIVEVLASEADVAREEWRWMDGLAEEFAARVSRSTGQQWRIDAAALNAAPLALARMVAQRALTALSSGRSVSLAHVEEVLRLCREGGAPVDLPGQRVEREREEVVLTSRVEPRSRKRGKGRGNAENIFCYPLSIPGEVRLDQAGCLVTAETARVLPAGAKLASGAIATVQLSSSAGPLAVRNRRPGDRFRPLGAGGWKKVQDFFVDRKIARHRRDSVPIVVDESDRIIWIAGHGIDERFRVRDPAQAVVILRLKLLGESA